jgi:hypothetical protein
VPVAKTWIHVNKFKLLNATIGFDDSFSLTLGCRVYILAVSNMKQVPVVLAPRPKPYIYKGQNFQEYTFDSVCDEMTIPVHIIISVMKYV